MVGASGADDTQGTFIPLLDGAIVGPMSLRLVRGSVLSGTILDEAGDPLGGVAVQVFRRAYASGQRAFGPSGSSASDDRGAFRIANLMPGEYLVGVVPRAADVDAAGLAAIANTGASGPTWVAGMAGLLLDASQNGGGAVPMAAAGGNQGAVRVPSAGSPIAPATRDGHAREYVPRFFPGTPASQASPIELGVGEERSGLVLQLTASEVSSIAGHVTSPAGVPRSTALTLIPEDDPLLATVDGLTAVVGSTGDFVLSGVPAGRYVLEARSLVEPARGAYATPPHRLFAHLGVTVPASEPAQVVITLRDGLQFSGEVHFDGATPPPTGATLTQWRVTLTDASGPPSLRLWAQASVALDANGHFTFPASLVPGDYRVVVGSGLVGPWSLESALINGHEDVDDVLHVETDLEHVILTVSDRHTEVTGFVRDGSGQPGTSATVVVFPRDRRLWASTSRRISAIRPLSDGRYVIKNLPAGEYLLAATADVERGQWYDPAFLATLERVATSVSLAPGGSATVNLQAVK